MAILEGLEDVLEVESGGNDSSTSYELLRLRVSVRDGNGLVANESERVCRVPYCMPVAEENMPSDEDMQPLNTEIQQGLQTCSQLALGTGQLSKLRRDVEALTQTIKQLLKTVRKMLGLRVFRVKIGREYGMLTGTPLELSWGLGEELLELPKDLLKIKDQLQELTVTPFSSQFNILPEWLGALTCLRTLHLDCLPFAHDSNERVLTLPDSMGGLCNLEKLTLKSFGKLAALPDVLGTLTSLKSLHIESCAELKKLPVCLESLRTLEVLHCDQIQGLPALPTLSKLGIYDCERLTTRAVLAYIWTLSGLLELGLDPVEQDQLPALHSNLEQLHTLDLCSQFLEKLPAWFSRMTALTHLSLQVPELRALPVGVGRLMALQKLDVRGCRQLQKLPFCMSMITGLKELLLANAPDLSFDTIAKQTSLQSLCIQNEGLCALPQSIGLLTSLRLTSLRLTGSCLSDEENRRCIRALPDAIGDLVTLEILELDGCIELKELPASICSLTCLQELVLRYSGVKDLPLGLEVLTQLRVLDIGVPASLEDCRIFRTLSLVLPALRRLEKLVLYRLQYYAQVLEIFSHDVCAVFSALKVCPPPLLAITGSIELHSDVLTRCWQLMALPPEAATWNNQRILHHFRTQQHKVAAFASGLHQRLGAESHVLSLNDQILVIIADDILGRDQFRRFESHWLGERLRLAEEDNDSEEELSADWSGSEQEGPFEY